MTSSFQTVGAKVDEIPVEISYRILELFSGGLYSSPTKAIEELVANSYDAMATSVLISIPVNLDRPDAAIVVADDGESMDIDGLRQLWHIGSSAKRENETTNVERRLPIGKFGIGKLASWVLAREMTHLCKRAGRYLAVTMLYSQLNTEIPTHTSKLTLDVRELTESEAQLALAPLTGQLAGYRHFPFFGEGANPSWTVAVLSNLKPLVRDLKLGRLKWVLSCAMPLTPDFRCVMNGLEIEPHRLADLPLNSWTIGKDDKVAANSKYPTDTIVVPDRGPVSYVALPKLGKVSGCVEVYKDTLTGGKAAEWGRSHGFFVMVRGRCVNLHDPLFGNTPLSHKTFNRFRMIVHCDGLDEFLLSSRESVTDAEATEELRAYLRSKFNEAQSWYDTWVATDDAKNRLATRLGNVPRSLMRRPLVDLVLKAVEGKGVLPRLTRVPTGLTKEEKARFIQKTEGYLESQEGFISDVVFESLGMDHPIALYDAKDNRVIINSVHPFYRNYEDYFKNPEPFQVLGVAEILTEAYLMDMGVNPDEVFDILSRRDDFLRELVYSGRLSAPLAADLLRSAVGDPNGLERAVAAALWSLGFEVTPIGGTDEPDGIAQARVGPRSTDEKAVYKVTYDAKSTSHIRVQTGNVHIAGIDRHRRKYDADYALIIARQFSDTRGEDSALINEARRMRNITLIEATDLALLVETAATKPLGYQRLAEFFQQCCTPLESRDWIQRFVKEEVKKPPIREILYAIHTLQGTQREEIQFADIRATGLQSYEKKEIGDWLKSVAALVPEYLTVRGDVVDLQMHPDKVLRAIAQSLQDRVPSANRDALLENVSQEISRQ